MTRYEHVYLSPHLDDAVLSCAGRMQKQVSRGDRVAVVTVFAGAPELAESFSSFAQALHAKWGHPAGAVEQRRREDEEALDLLGADAVHWPYTDCIYRRTSGGAYAYASEEALWGRLHPADKGLIDELASELSDLPLMPEAALYAPLAVGEHVDHRIVRRAAEGSRRALTFYEDFPYAEEKEAIEAALSDGQWEAELVPLEPHELRGKVLAIARYCSQITSFWADAEAMAASVRAFASRTGGGSPAERYWRPVARARP